MANYLPQCLSSWSLSMLLGHIDISVGDRNGLNELCAQRNLEIRERWFGNDAEKVTDLARVPDEAREWCQLAVLEALCFAWDHAQMRAKGLTAVLAWARSRSSALWDLAQQIRANLKPDCKAARAQIDTASDRLLDLLVEDLLPTDCQSRRRGRPPGTVEYPVGELVAQCLYVAAKMSGGGLRHDTNHHSFTFREALTIVRGYLPARSLPVKLSDNGFVTSSVVFQSRCDRNVDRRLPTNSKIIGHYFRLA